MSANILSKLKVWRKETADREGVELFRIFQNKTLDAIAQTCPRTKEEFLNIKGVGEKKFECYGKELLSIIRESLGEAEEIAPGDLRGEDQIFSVSGYLDILNGNLAHFGAMIRGEVSGLNFRGGHAYFSLKDKSDGSLLNCFMWARNYAMSGVELVEGMEIIAHGLPEVYKPTGKLTLRIKMIELVGEGALKKAYEELKKALEAEGLFSAERKKILPDFPHKIGLITSRDGAVINDFMSNIGNFGFKITFFDSRVEGALAVMDLARGVEYFADKDIDVLVIIRGGGSLESLQAFNNEMLVRTIAQLEMPVICGIGHDKDIPLLSFVADKAVSTPTAVAQGLNTSWERARDRLSIHEKSIMGSYETILRDVRYDLEVTSSKMKDFYRLIFDKFEQFELMIKQNFVALSHSIRHEQQRIERMGELLLIRFGDTLIRVARDIAGFEKDIKQGSPERQLRLGYSIITLNGKVVRSVRDVRKGDVLLSTLSDGNVQSGVQEIFDN